MIDFFLSGGAEGVQEDQDCALSPPPQRSPPISLSAGFLSPPRACCPTITSPGPWLWAWRRREERSVLSAEEIIHPPTSNALPGFSNNCDTDYTTPLLSACVDVELLGKAR